MSTSSVSRMVFGSAVSKHVDPLEAARDAAAQLTAALNGSPIDILFLFISPHYRNDLADIQSALRAELKPDVFLGCTAASVITREHELEGEQALSLLSAHLPGTRLEPFHLTQSELEAHADADALKDVLGLTAGDKPSFILFADPFTFDAAGFMQLMDQAFPGSPVMGGLASAAAVPGQNLLISGDLILAEGAVGVALTGNVEIASLVSQGCRPFGEPFIVTNAEENVIRQLAGRPAMEVLRETFLNAPKRDQELARHSLFVGCVVDEYKEKLGRGDFVIRNVISTDPESGALAIGDYINVGQTVQFHVRDARTAHDDLTYLCTRRNDEHDTRRPAGALMFSCNGRGRHMFKQKHHDVSTLRKEMGSFPVAGFFCAGEMGPIGSRNFLHGFTSSIALFYSKES